MFAYCPGIRRNKTMADKLMYIANDATQNYPFCRLQFVVKRQDTLLKQTTNQLWGLVKLTAPCPLHFLILSLIYFSNYFAI